MLSLCVAVFVYVHIQQVYVQLHVCIYMHALTEVHSDASAYREPICVLVYVYYKCICTCICSIKRLNSSLKAKFCWPEFREPWEEVWATSLPLFSSKADGFHLPEVLIPGACERFFLQALATADTKKKLKFLSLVWILKMFLQIKLRWG